MLIVVRFGKYCCCNVSGNCVLIVINQPDLVGHSQYAITPKVATTVFAKLLDNYQHMMRPKPESQSFTSRIFCGYALPTCK
jgi:hypothetical protein